MRTISENIFTSIICSDILAAKLITKTRMEQLFSKTLQPVACIIKLTMSFLCRRTDQRRYLWIASIDIYLALYDSVKTTS